MNFLSVVIPAYNESSRIVQTAESVARYLENQACRWEIVVVDDGSTDDTSQKVEQLSNHLPNLRVTRHPLNQGKGAAIRTGLEASKGEAVLLCDADGATPIEQTGDLLNHLGSGVGIVSGSRRITGSQVITKQGWTRRWMSSIYQRLCRFLLIPGISDVTCGFKLLSRNLADLCVTRMRIKGWSFDVEIFLIARTHNLKIMEIPVRWAHQRRSKVRLGRDALGSFWELLQIKSNAIRGLYR